MSCHGVLERGSQLLAVVQKGFKCCQVVMSSQYTIWECLQWSITNLVVRCELLSCLVQQQTQATSTTWHMMSWGCRVCGVVLALQGHTPLGAYCLSWPQDNFLSSKMHEVIDSQIPALRLGGSEHRVVNHVTQMRGKRQKNKIETQADSTSKDKVKQVRSNNFQVSLATRTTHAMLICMCSMQQQQRPTASRVPRG